MKPSTFSPTRHLTTHLHHHQAPLLNKRPFLTNTLQPPSQSLTATRILSFPASSLYTIIADIDAYSTFLPFLSSSKVTHWSAPDATYNKQWPQRAELHVGYAGYEESFQSNVYCQPGKIVEAIAGDAQSTIDKEELKHYTSDTDETAPKNQIFNSLLTRWNLNSFPYKPPASTSTSSSTSSNGLQSPPHAARALKTPHHATEQTQINLTIQYQFANPAYAALSKAFAPKIANLMIEAFEKRAVSVLGVGGDGPGISGDERDEER